MLCNIFFDSFQHYFAKITAEKQKIPFYEYKGIKRNSAIPSDANEGIAGFREIPSEIYEGIAGICLIHYINK